MMASKTTLFAARFAVGMLLLGGTARADGDDWQAARALVLFNLGRVDLKAGRHADALAKFLDSQKLDPAPGTMLNLAYCYAKLGKVATAWAEYNAAAVLAREQAKLDWEKDALEQARRLETSLPRVVVQVEKPKDGKWPEVLLDETPLPRSLWGEATPVDPGTHEVRAMAAAGRSWTKTFDVDVEREPTVIVPALEPAELAPEEKPLDRPSSPLPPADVTPARPVSLAIGGRSRSLTYAAFAAGGAGAVALGVGAAFGLAAIVNNNASNEGRQCVSKTCNPAGESDRVRAMHDAQTADVAFAVGAAGLATGAVLWALGLPRATGDVRGSRVSLYPTVSPGAWSLSVGEAW